MEIINTVVMQVLSDDQHLVLDDWQVYDRSAECHWQ